MLASVGSRNSMRRASRRAVRVLGPVLLGSMPACGPRSGVDTTQALESTSGEKPSGTRVGANGPWGEENALMAERAAMGRDQIASRGVSDPEVLRAMRTVPREKFVPERYRDMAHTDGPLPIGHDVTILQPLIVASMTELADVNAGSRVLEIGTGSGYQAAVLAEIGAKVYSIEIIEPLANEARLLLDALGYSDVQIRVGDGYEGWPEEAPFDAIIVTAAPPQIPDPLRRQLADGGRLVVPVGEYKQELRVVTRLGEQFEESRRYPVRFVPMIGRAQEVP